MAHYLVTGGAGFIGSHLVEHLLAADALVTVLDDFSTGRRENLSAHPRLTLVERDLLEVAAEELRGKFDGVVHLAALPSVYESWTDLSRAHHLNLSATVRMLELSRALAIPKIVYASSAAVYGDPQSLPIGEDDATLPMSPYGLQKLTGEHYGRLVAQNAGPAFVALRFFNVFGPRQVATSAYSGVISKFAAAMRAGAPIQINGDGTQTRDFVYVADVARGIAQALAAKIAERFVVCNLGTGRAVSIRELAGMMRAFFPDWREACETSPALPGDIVHSQAKIARARQLFGYEPGFSVEAGLAALMESGAID